MKRAIVLLFAVLFCLDTTAFGYEAVEVKGGGEVAGVVTLKGTPPRAPATGFSPGLAEADRKFCSTKQPVVLSAYLVDGAAHLKDVVVWLEGVTQGKAPRRETRRLSNTDCRFAPHVLSIDVGADIIVDNNDPILHNTHPVYIHDQSTLFNIALPMKGQEIKKKAKRAGALKVGCDVHPWMLAYVHVFDHPYHAVTSADGKFRLTDVPPGKYTLHAWHEAAGKQSRPVEVTASGKLAADLTFDVKS